MSGRLGQRQSGIKPYKAGALLCPPVSATPHHYSDIGNDSTAAVPAESRCSIYYTLPTDASKQSEDFPIDSPASGSARNSAVATQEDDLRCKLVASELLVDQLQLCIDALTSELAYFNGEACEPSAQKEKRQPSSAEESFMHATMDVRPDDVIDEEQAVVLLRHHGFSEHRIRVILEKLEGSVRE